MINDIFVQLVLFLLLWVRQIRWCNIYDIIMFSKNEYIWYTISVGASQEEIDFVGRKFLKISEANQIYFRADESCLSVKAIYSLRVWKYFLLETQILTLHLQSI